MTNFWWALGFCCSTLLAVVAIGIGGWMLSQTTWNQGMRIGFAFWVTVIIAFGVAWMVSNIAVK